MFSSDRPTTTAARGRDERPIAEFETDLTAEDWAAKRRAGELGFGPIFWAPYPGALADDDRRPRAHEPHSHPPDNRADGRRGAVRRVRPPANRRHRNPAVSVHFNPSAYGATGAGTYVFTFAVDAPTRAGIHAERIRGQRHRRRTGLRSASAVAGSSRSSSGTSRPAQDASAAIEQTSGEAWSWFSTRISASRRSSSIRCRSAERANLAFRTGASRVTRGRRGIALRLRPRVARSRRLRRHSPRSPL